MPRFDDVVSLICYLCLAAVAQINISSAYFGSIYIVCVVVAIERSTWVAYPVNDGRLTSGRISANVLRQSKKKKKKKKEEEKNEEEEEEQEEEQEEEE